MKSLPRRRNPLPRPSRGPSLHLSPSEFQDQLKRSKIKALRRFQKDLRKQLSSFGLNPIFTLVSKDQYQQRLRQTMDGPDLRAWADAYNDTPDFARFRQSKIYKADGAVLVTRKSDLARILLGGYWDSPGLQRVAKLYQQNFDFPPEELNDRMKLVVDLLRFNPVGTLARKYDFYVSKHPLPFIFRYPSTSVRKRGAHNLIDYKAYPIYFFVEEMGPPR